MKVIRVVIFYCTNYYHYYQRIMIFFFTGSDELFISFSRGLQDWCENKFVVILPISAPEFNSKLFSGEVNKSKMCISPKKNAHLTKPNYDGGAIASYNMSH